MRNEKFKSPCETQCGSIMRLIACHKEIRNGKRKSVPWDKSYCMKRRETSCGKKGLKTSKVFIVFRNFARSF